MRLIPFSPMFRRALAATAICAIVATAVWATLIRRESIPPRTEFVVELFAPFLEPGPAPTFRYPVALTNIERHRSGGAADVHVWHAGSRVRFETDASGALGTLDIQPRSKDAKSDVWNVWRHRHGYGFVVGAGYFWNTLGDVRLPIDRAAGLRFDAFLKRVWGYWTVRALEGSVNLPLDSTLPRREPHRVSVRLPLTERGLARPVPAGFQINPWGVPVKIGFELHTSTVAAARGRLVSVKGPARWTYDRHEWRGRHGYERTLFRGYQWRNGFPADVPLSDEDGRALDALLDRGLAFWVEATVELFIADLNHRIRAWRDAGTQAEPIAG